VHAYDGGLLAWAELEISRSGAPTAFSPRSRVLKFACASGLATQKSGCCGMAASSRTSTATITTPTVKAHRKAPQARGSSVYTVASHCCHSLRVPGFLLEYPSHPCGGSDSSGINNGNGKPTS
jgi:hypothetical protein